MDDPLVLARLRRQTLGRYRYTRQRWRMLFAVIDAAGCLLFALGRAARALLPRTRSSTPAADPKRLLLVQLDHLGDAVITTVMLPALRRRYPTARIEVLASPWNREIFEGSAEVDHVDILKNNRFARNGGRWWPLAVVGWGLRLRRRRYDLAIDVRGELPLALLLWLSGARRRVGWACGGGGFLLTHSPPYVPGRAEVESRLALLAELGIRQSAGDEPWRPCFVPSSEARRRASKLWKSFAGNPRERCERIVFHVGAGTPAKCWPAEHWWALLQRIAARGSVRVALVGAEGNRTIAGQIATRGAAEHIADWTGRLSIAELAAVIRDADLFVGADSGPAHLAAAVGTPVVVLFSGTNLASQWQPSGRRVVVVRNPVACSPCHREQCPVPGHPCMRGLAPACVAEQIVRLLDRPETGESASIAEPGTRRERTLMHPDVAQKTIVKRNSFRLERDDRVPFAVLVDETKGET